MPLPNDELDGAFIANQAGAEAERLRQKFAAMRESELAVSPNPMAADVAPDPSKTFSSMLKGTARDIASGLRPTNLGMELIGGARDAVQGTLNAVDSLGDWMNENVVDLDQAIIGRPAPQGDAPQLPDVAEPKSNTGNLIRGAAQFMLPFAKTLGLVRDITGGKAVSKLGQFAQAEGAAAITAATVFDPHEERLSNFLKQFGDVKVKWGDGTDLVDIPLDNAVTEYLAADPNDSEIEGRFKNAIEGLGLGVLSEGFFQGVRVLRANRVEKGVTPGRFTAIRATEQPPDEGTVSYDIMPRAGGEPVGFAELTIEGDTAYVNLIDSYAPEAGTGPAQAGPNLLGTKEMKGMVQKLVEDYPQVKFISGERISGAREKSLIDKGAVPGDVPLTVVPVSKFVQRGLNEPEEPIVTVLGHPDEPLILSKNEVSSSDLFDALSAKQKEIRGAFADNPDAARQIDEAFNNDPELKRIEQQIRDELGPQNISDEQISSFLDSGQLPFKQPFQYNWSRFTSSEDIQQAVNDTSQIFSGRINEARRGKLTDDTVRELAEDLGMTPEDLLARQRGQTFNAEQIVASKMLLEAATTKVQELARVARGSTDEADLFAFQQMLNIHVGIQAQLQGAASEAGRALHALQIPVGSVEKQIGQINEMLMAGGGPDKMRQLAEAVSQVNDPARIAAAARGSWGKRINDAIIEYWYFALLSNPATQVVNFTSNGLNALWQIPERALAAQVNNIRGGARGVEAGEATAMMYGMMGGLYDAVRLAGRTLLTGETSNMASKLETRVPAAITSDKFPLGKKIGGPVGAWTDSAIDGLGTFIRLPTRALMGADEFYKTIGKSMQMKALAYRKATQEGLEGDTFARRVNELLEHPTGAITDSSQAFANDLTFTTELGKFGKSVQNLTNTIPPLKFAVPFTKTPANIFKWAGKRSPFAPLSKSIWADIKRGGPEGDLAIARITMGSAMGLIMADLAARGLVTGAGPNDPELRTTWLRTHQPFSLKLGKSWYSYNRLDPFGLLMGASSTYGEIAAYSDADTLEDYATAIAMATSRSVFNKTWMSGAADLADTMASADENKYKRFAQRFTGSLLVPAGVAQTARVIDPYWREVNSIGDAIRARTPGYSNDMPATRNLWGQKIMLEGGLGPDIISPIYKQSIKDRPIDTWMLDNRVNVKMPARGQTFLGADVELTPKQYERFVELAGNVLKNPNTSLGAYDTLNAMIEGTHPQSGTWAMTTDGPEGGRSQMVRDVIANFRDMAKRQLYEEDSELRSRVTARQAEKTRVMMETVMRPNAGAAP